MTLESKLRTEADSQDLMLERDKLVQIMKILQTKLDLLQYDLNVMAESYNSLVQKHVAKRDSEEKKDDSQSTGLP